MAGEIEKKLQELGITLPSPMAPIANYVPFVRTGDLVFVSGQVPAVDGKIAVTGKVGDGLSIEQGAARGTPVLHQCPGASQGRHRRQPRPGAAGGAPWRLHRRPRLLHPACADDERRLRPRRRGVRRGRAACPHHHRRALPARRRRGGSGGHLPHCLTIFRPYFSGYAGRIDHAHADLARGHRRSFRRGMGCLRGRGQSVRLARVSVRGGG